MFKKTIKIIYNYIVFFLLVAFSVTCTTSLFVKNLASALGTELTSDNLGKAAKLTFLNVLVLSLLFTLIDALRRHFTTEKYSKEISLGAKELLKGNYDVRVTVPKSPFINECFIEIADSFNALGVELQGLESLKNDFIADVSHEMKTPLAVIQSYATLLQKPDLSEEKRIEYACGISAASKKSAEMISNILKLNRLENQKIYPQGEKYDLSEQICECLLQYEDVWEEKEIDLQTDIGEGIYVCADRELLAIVWSNLFSNAFKFTDCGGSVSVTLKKDGGYGVIEVCDSGCGISCEVGERIFEKFYQGDSSHATQGNGLGLALVKRVIDIMQGEVGVKSTVGVGTTFTVRIKTDE